MFAFRFCKPRPHNLKFLPFFSRNGSDLKVSPYTGVVFEEVDEKLIDVLKKCGPKLVFNSLLERKKLWKHSPPMKALNRLNKQLTSVEPVPLSLKYLTEEIEPDEPTKIAKTAEEDSITHFPYQDNSEIEQTASASVQKPYNVKDSADAANEEVRKRHELQQDMNNWMTAYDNFDDANLEEETEDAELGGWKINYGTPDPNSSISKVPCGGCGALLHCKDTAIPGYIPSEIYNNTYKKGGANLSAIVCQRCHFLEHYNLALQMRVSPDDYPKVLTTISQQQGLVVLMVDLLDFPCSIWPGIADIFSTKMPIVVVGNKVDLLPKDDNKYLTHIKETLLRSVQLSGFATLNIKHVALISAKTGFGVEDLITRLLSLYNYKGDVYIVGCTNVGKSSLFNALLQSDFCKNQATDLIQRATTSIWPGTTLNLLKFPVKRPAGYRQVLRHKRLEDAKLRLDEENSKRKEQLKVTGHPKYATLIGRIDVTKNLHAKIDEDYDSFSTRGHQNASGKLQMGINEKSMEFAYSKWCYDTPGVVQPDQVTHLLTTEELLLTLPKQLILPRTFCLKPRMTLFIAGLSRLDYMEGPGSVRLTVFASNQLPVTVCNFDHADEIYDNLLGTELFRVPTGNLERLAKWPRLELARKFTIIGDQWYKSANDIVLSSSGWIAVTGKSKLQYQFQAWSPEKRGVYLRECLLPNAIALRGSRIGRSVAYKKHKFYLK